MRLAATRIMAGEVPRTRDDAAPGDDRRILVRAPGNLDKPPGLVSSRGILSRRGRRPLRYHCRAAATPLKRAKQRLLDF
jgi:hypothetical protein